MYNLFVLFLLAISMLFVYHGFVSKEIMMIIYAGSNFEKITYSYYIFTIIFYTIVLNRTFHLYKELKVLSVE
jgi:hypothetical protein